MKITKILTIFGLTFLLGCLTVFAYFSMQRQREKEKINAELDNLVNFVNTNKGLGTDEIKHNLPIEEEIEVEEAEIPAYKIEMLRVGTLHEEETMAKSGETWLGLFNHKGKSYLTTTKIKLSRFHDIGDGENKKRKTGKEIDVANTDKPTILLKNAKTLKVGKVTTLFLQDEKKYEESNLKNGFKKEFTLKGKTFTLKVINENSTEEYLSKGSKLVLSFDGIEQIVHPQGNQRIGESWTLYWAGDLDNDGKLDFLADLSDHYNSTDVILFLSSEAEKGKLVKDVAGLFTVGC